MHSMLGALVLKDINNNVSDEEQYLVPTEDEKGFQLVSQEKARNVGGMTLRGVYDALKATIYEK